MSIPRILIFKLRYFVIFKKSLIVIVIVLTLCFGFAACASDTKDLKARITALEQELANAKQADVIKNDSVAAQVYYLGDTFTYLAGGLELFSIKIEESSNPSIIVNITVKNLNLPGRAPDDFVNMQCYNGNTYSTYTFSATPLQTGGEYSTPIGYPSANGGKIWHFGFPATKSLIPYAIFDLT